MDIIDTEIEGLFIFQPNILKDDRGYFFESYSQKNVYQIGLNQVWVQDNEAQSTFGVLRGLHYQKRPMAQAKLVRVIVGKVQDVVVDIRPKSKTYGQHFSIILSEENKTQLLIPRGFAHGYLVLSKLAIFTYKCDQFYSREDEGGIKFDDPILGIDWQIDVEKLVVSEKDASQPLFGDHKTF